MTIMLRKDGDGVVTAADFDLPHDVTVLNPDHVIAHLSGGRLEMQVKIERVVAISPVMSVLSATTIRSLQLAALSWMRPSRRSFAWRIR